MSIEKPEDSGVSRRAMLMKLGLAATAAYAAPVLLRLGDAHASGGSGGSGGRGSGGRGSGGRGSGGRGRGGGGGRGSFSGFSGRRAGSRRGGQDAGRALRSLFRFGG